MTLNLAQPFVVPAHIGQVKLEVTTSQAIAVDLVAGTMQRAVAKRGIRLAGGCSGMSAQDRLNMIEYFLQELTTFRGLLSSGATRSITPAGLIDPMVTDIPAALAAANPASVLTIGTAPRTGKMQLVENSRLVLSDTGDIFPNPGIHLLVLIQAADGGELDWYDELKPYLTLFASFVNDCGWRFATIVWNGGGVTRAEALMAAELGWPVFLVVGSGRAADELAAEQASGTLHYMLDGQRIDLARQHYANVVPISKAQAGTLSAALQLYGFL